MTIFSDASTIRAGVHFARGTEQGVHGMHKRKKLHINVLELKAAKLAIMTFLKSYLQVKSIHAQMNNITSHYVT